MTTLSEKRVFIVDDSPIVRMRLSRLIAEIPGASVVGESDKAEEALAQIPRARPHLVIMDISMPGGSGMFLLEQVKRSTPRLPVIMLSNFSHASYREKCRQLGADYFFDKSTEFEKVVRVIQELDATPLES